MTRGDHRAMRRRRPFRVAMALGVFGSAVVVAVGVIGPFFRSPTSNSTPASKPPAQTSGPTVQGSVAASAPPVASPPTDSGGFVNSFARCDGELTPVALARTTESLVAICISSRGQHAYRGVRVNTGGTLSLDSVAANPNGFVAHNEQVAYSVSSAELLITAGSTVIAREAMVEFDDLGGRPTATAPPAAPEPLPAAPTSPQPAPTPAVEYPPVPFTTTGTGGGTVKFIATQPSRFKYAVECPADTAVRGFIDASAPQHIPFYTDDIRGDTSSRRAGTSRILIQTGPIVLSIQAFDAACGWTLSAFPSKPE